MCVVLNGLLVRCTYTCTILLSSALMTCNYNCQSPLGCMWECWWSWANPQHLSCYGSLHLPYCLLFDFIDNMTFNLFAKATVHFIKSIKVCRALQLISSDRLTCEHLHTLSIQAFCCCLTVDCFFRSALPLGVKIARDGRIDHWSWSCIWERCEARSHFGVSFGNIAPTWKLRKTKNYNVSSQSSIKRLWCGPSASWIRNTQISGGLLAIHNASRSLQIQLYSKDRLSGKAWLTWVKRLWASCISRGWLRSQCSQSFAQKISNIWVRAWWHAKSHRQSTWSD